MWIATKHGFYSIVEKTPGVFHSRARLKKDLANLLAILPDAKDVTIQKWPGAGYRWRIVTDRAFAMRVVLQTVVNINYSNFKSIIDATPDQREKLGAYHDLWSRLYRIQK